MPRANKTISISSSRMTEYVVAEAAVKANNGRIAADKAHWADITASSSCYVLLHYFISLLAAKTDLFQWLCIDSGESLEGFWMR